MVGSRVEPDRLTQRLDLTRAQHAMLTRSQVAEGEWTYADADQVFDRAADGAEHAAYLALAALQEHDAHDCAGGRGAQQLCADRPRQTVFEHHPPPKQLQL